MVNNDREIKTHRRMLLVGAVTLLIVSINFGIVAFIAGNILDVLNAAKVVATACEQGQP